MMDSRLLRYVIRREDDGYMASKIQVNKWNDHDERDKHKESI